MVTSTRTEEFASIRDAVKSWANRDATVVAVAVVGSWARGEPQMDSDVDVVVLTTTDRFVAQADWVEDLCGQDAALTRTADWGAVTERRVRLASGFEIEFGFANPAWADVTPLEDGTRRVVADGCEVWYDPNSLLGRLLGLA